MLELEHVLIPIDGSSASAEAAKAGIAFERREQAGAEHVGAICVVEVAFPAEGILAAARKGKCYAIFMGSHGWRGLKRLLGSVTSRVLANADRPVIVYR